MIKQFFFFLLLLLCIQLSAQQKEFIFKNFTQEEGLPSNETYCVFEDSKHYLWIGTDLGVARYNGSKFEVFNLPDNVIFKIREDKKGRIWFFTRKAKLSYFENEKIYPYKYNDSLAAFLKKDAFNAEINITDAYVDDDDNVILNSSAYANYVISNKGNIKVQFYVSQPGTAVVYEIKKNKPASWFATKLRWPPFYSDSLTIITTNAGEKKRYEIPVKLEHYIHYGALYYDDNTIFFFAGKQLIRLNKDGTYKVKNLPNYALSICRSKEKIYVGMINSGALILNPDLEDECQSTLETKSVTSITPDYEGGIWFTTLENGLYYIKNTNIKHISGINGPKVTRLLNVDNRFLLFGTSTGIHKLENMEVSVMAEMNNYNISDIITDSGNNLFVARGIGQELLYKKYEKANKDFKNIFSINTGYETGRFRNGDFILNIVYSVLKLTVPTTKSGIDKDLADPNSAMSRKSKILFKPANLFIDKRNKAWAAAYDGIYYMNDSATAFTRLHLPYPLLNQGASCIRQLNNELLAVGSRFDGLVMIKDTSLLAVISEKEGLLSNKIKSLLSDDDKLWVATAKGISVIRFVSFDPLKYEIVNIGRNEGFYNITINHLVKYRGDIYVATNNGIYCIENTTHFFSGASKPIPFYINNVNYNDKDTFNVRDILIPYEKNRLFIKYLAVCFNAPEEIRYLYRFGNNDTTWYSTSNTERLLENLEPGNYTLQIKATLPSFKRESEVRKLFITVGKPWWQNNWLRLSVLLLIFFIIYFFVSRRIRKIKNEARRKTELNAKLAELEQTALRAQMNPHFIFNCLASIQQLIVSGNKTDANEYLVKFSRLIRKTLELSAHSFISIREEREYLNEYLFLEQLRLAGQFEYKITCDDSIDVNHTLIPNMMIQPVVENCVRHGIKSLDNKHGVITVHFERNQDFISCNVTDNGVGRKHTATGNEKTFSKHKSYGMDIVQKRLETLSAFENDGSYIKINDLYHADGSSAGTEVILHFPLKKNSQ